MPYCRVCGKQFEPFLSIYWSPYSYCSFKCAAHGGRYVDLALGIVSIVLEAFFFSNIGIYIILFGMFCLVISFIGFVVKIERYKPGPRYIDKSIQSLTNTLEKDYLCANCGTQLSIDDLICPKCGQSTIKKDSNCPKCGTLISKEDEFCSKCGFKKNSGNNLCPVCGATMYSGDVRCWSCGAEINENLLKQEVNRSRCYGCGAKITPQDEYCPKCGRNFS